MTFSGLVLLSLSLFDVERRLLFIHIPKTAGNSITSGIQAFVANQTARRGCADFDWLSTPPGLPGRKPGEWKYELDERAWNYELNERGGDNCSDVVMPQCDFTLQGMGCVGGAEGAYAHKSEEYVRAEMRFCSHDGLRPILAPDANGVVNPVVSFALIRDPMDRLTSAWSHRLNSHNNSVRHGSHDELPPYLVDFNDWVQSGAMFEIASRLWQGVEDEQAEDDSFCSRTSGIFEVNGWQYVRMYGGPDDNDYHYYYGGNAYVHAFTLPASAMVTECTVLLPMIGDISQPDSTVMQFLDSFYPGYAMGHESHRSGDEVRHYPVISAETQRVVREVYSKDYRLWELVKNGTAYYPPNWRNCTAKLPDGSRAVPPAKARSPRGAFERSLQPR